jgi:hypothetical protein
MTQKMMAEMYGVSVQAIQQHIATLVEKKEIDSATIKQYLIVQREGIREVKRNIDHYNLQAIIAVGFKIENDRAVQFRKWARQIVKDYTIQGWAMDSERLKQANQFDKEFFERQRAAFIAENSQKIDFPEKLKAFDEAYSGFADRVPYVTPIHSLLLVVFVENKLMSLIIYIYTNNFTKKII